MGQSPWIKLVAQISVVDDDFMENFPDSKVEINNTYLRIEQDEESGDYLLTRVVLSGWGETTDIDQLQHQLRSFVEDVEDFSVQYNCTVLSTHIGTKFD